MDPVRPRPTTALLSSYTYHSPISAFTQRTYIDAPTAAADDAPTPSSPAPEVKDKKGKGKEKVRWIMGIDEAGRGPVLGPMVYGCAFCPLSFAPTLETLGFDDSKALSHQARDHLFELFANSHEAGSDDGNIVGHEELHYSTRVLAPREISRDMLRGTAGVNLNRQAEEATIALIGDVVRRGVDVAECYVDALGACGPWQAKLSALFPTIAFTVCPKADSLFKIVGAASIAAKITRDRWIEHWIHPEPIPIVPIPIEETPAAAKKRKLAATSSSGSVGGRSKGKKAKLVQVGETSENEGDEREGEGEGEGENLEVAVATKNGLGSGYPSDPNTKRYLTTALDPIFGFPSLVRFSWSTVKVLLDKEAKMVRWIDQVGAGSGHRAYFGSNKTDVADRERVRVWKEVGLRSVGEL